MYEYEKDGAEIYRQSFATIRAEAELGALPEDVARVAVRMIHACGQVDLVDDLAFSPAVVARAREIWGLFAAMMPAHGAVLALDGILIGPSDTRFLMWGMLAAALVYVPVALLALQQGWGILGVWCGLAGLIAVRLATCGLRFAGERWALTGARAG